MNCAEKYKAKINFNIKDREGKTPLILASKMCFAAAAEFILEKIKHFPELDVNLADEQGNTALHYACALGQTNLVISLLSAGANSSLRNNQGQIPGDMLMLKKVELSKILNSVDVEPSRDEGAKYNIFHDKNFQPLVSTTQGEMSIACKKANLSNLESALRGNLYDSYSLLNGIRVHMKSVEKAFIRSQVKNFTGRSLLDSCSAQQDQVLETLYKNKHIDELFAFSYYITKNNLPKVKEMLAINPSLINAKNAVDETPLHTACKECHLLLVDFLLDKHALAYCENSQKQTPFNLLTKNFKPIIGNEQKSQQIKLRLLSQMIEDKKAQELPEPLSQKAAANCIT